MSEIDERGGWADVLGTLIRGEDLSAGVAGAAMSTILSGEATAAQIAGLVVGLRAKGESVVELAAMLDAAMERAAIVPLTDAERSAAIDVVGTGGDGSHSINVSTMTAIVVGSTGTPVCKHGNRSASSKCGTADVLEWLGVAIEQTPEGVATCVREVGIGFCYAPAFHPAFRFAGPPRREMGVPTVFNLIGPMANPGRVRNQLIGVADPRVAPTMLGALERQGVTSAWVVHGDGLDELTTSGVSQVWELRDGVQRSFTVDPIDVGIGRVSTADLRGGDPEENADAVHRVLAGEAGPHRDVVVLNAGAALLVAGQVEDLGAGVDLARAAIDDGRAAETLARFVTRTQELVRE